MATFAFPAPALQGFAAAVLVAWGASDANADAVAAHLVDNDLAGIHSHGLMRIPQYVREIERGELDPAASPRVERREAARVWLNGARTFGQVAGTIAVGEAADTAAQAGIAFVSVRHAGHAGRIGAYTEALARTGALALAFCSGPRSGHWVAPVGGIDGRLATNPISYAYPSRPAPVVADFSTSAAAEGTIRALRDLRAEAPPDVLQSADGSPTTDPHVLYADPPGAIQPLGGRQQGHKGYALAVLVEAMATLLASDESSDGTRFGNNLALVAIRVDAGFAERAGRLSDYLRSSRPLEPDVPVLLPGDVERLARTTARSVVLDEPTRSALADIGDARGITLPEALGGEARAWTSR